MQKENLDKVVLRKLKIEDNSKVDLKKWNEFLYKLNNPKQSVSIALVGKYNKLKDSYKSIIESFIHSGTEKNCVVNIKWINAEDLLNKSIEEKLSDINGLLVAPGFGDRGIEGKIKAIKYVRENNIPFLGICLGMQCAVIEYARNVLGLKNANSTEMKNETPFPVIDIMTNQKTIIEKGGTMRLGSYSCNIIDDSKAFEAYKLKEINERHRHRYEFNNQFLKQFQDSGMIATGKNKENNLVEIVEIKSHQWFVGVQFHPEYSSTVLKPNPLFSSFIDACLKNKI
jgi:CTP synthase